MISGYFIIFCISIVLFFLTRKFAFNKRFIISISTFIIFSMLFTGIVLKISSEPMQGKKYTLEQWKEKNLEYKKKIEDENYEYQ